MKKLAIAAAAVLTLGLTGCMETTYTFEATPVGVSEDAAEDGLTREQVDSAGDCFVIEADSSDGDDASDQQLGLYHKPGISEERLDECQRLADQMSIQEANDEETE